MEKDRVFAKKKDRAEPFLFNPEVANVFDDMLIRSVPLYGESIRRQTQMCGRYYRENSRIYDLGCSNGNLGILILEQLKGQNFSMIGVDSSFAMIEKYAQRLRTWGNRACVKLICGFMEDIHIKNASVVVMNLTLQFIHPSKRDSIISRIFDGLNPGGILILTEKTIHTKKDMNDLQLYFYKRFKLENGYSELEISQKREALERVLCPDTMETHENRLKQAGFKTVETWLKWFNFASLMAIKT